MHLPFKIYKRSQDLALLSQTTFTPERHLGVGLDLAIHPILTNFHSPSSLYPNGTFYGGHIEFMPMAVGTIAKEVVTDPPAQQSDLFRLKEWSSMEFLQLGTKLIDQGWQPLILLIGLIIGLFVYHSTNLSKAIGVLIFLVLYNFPLWLFRIWTFQIGWRYGRDSIAYLKSLPIHQTAWIFQWLGAGLVGVAIVITSKEWGKIVFAFGKHLAEELAWISIAIGFLIGYLLLHKISLYSILLILSVVVFSVAILF